jgi:Tfp pilus assembly protein PilV
MVSVLVAIVLLSAGVVVMSSSSLFMTSVETDARTRSTASSIAMAYMEQLKTRERSSLDSEAPVQVNERGLEDNNGKFVREVTVEPEPSVADAVQLAVTVLYPGGLGRQRAVVVRTIVYVGS